MNNCEPTCQTANQLAHLKTQRQQTIDFLHTIKSEAGMMLRPAIEQHIARLTGGCFDPTAWNVMDINGNQGV